MFGVFDHVVEPQLVGFELVGETVGVAEGCGQLAGELVAAAGQLMLLGLNRAVPLQHR